MVNQARFRASWLASPPTPGRSERSERADYAPGLLIDVVLRLKTLEQGLQKGLGLVRCSADRLCHFLSGRRKISAVRRNSCQRQVADPVIRILLRNLRIQFKRPLGVPRPLQPASVG